jgi:hypothetical protein
MVFNLISEQKFGRAVRPASKLIQHLGRKHTLTAHRARRIKCDEGKPRCQRCLLYGVECDGYLYSTNTLATPLSRIIAPKPKSALTVLNLHGAMPSRSLFKNDQEYRYFSLFCEEAAGHLSGPFPSTLWSQIILQACESDSSIRYAVVALGALNITQSRSLTYDKQSSAARMELAFCNYSKAISQMRRTISNGYTPELLRTTVIACILFACFETYNGFCGAARTQVFSGAKILQQWARRQNQALLKETATRPAPIEDE